MIIFDIKKKFFLSVRMYGIVPENNVATIFFYFIFLIQNILKKKKNKKNYF